MKYFTEIMSIEQLRTQFREYCLELHPDKGGDHKEFIEMKAEYDKVIERASKTEFINAESENRKANFSFADEKELAEFLEKLMRVKGVVIELCGSWLWVSGNTILVKDQLKGFGMRFSKKKTAWYYSPYMGKTKRRGRYSMEKIRDTFGSTIIQGSKEENIIAA